MDINHHSENILQASSSLTKDQLSDSARLSFFFKKQMEIWWRTKVGSRVINSPPGCSWHRSISDLGRPPFTMESWSVKTTSSLPSGFRWCLVNGRQKQRWLQGKNKKDQVFIPWLPPVVQHVGSGCLSLLKAISSKCGPLLSSAAVLTRLENPPASSFFFRPGRAQVLLFVTSPPGFTITPGFPSFWPHLKNSPLLKLSLVSPLECAFSFLLGTLTSWSSGTFTIHMEDWENPSPQAKCTDKAQTWAKAWMRSRNLSVDQRIMMGVGEDDKSFNTEGTTSGKSFVWGWPHIIANIGLFIDILKKVNFIWFHLIMGFKLW